MAIRSKGRGWLGASLLVLVLAFLRTPAPTDAQDYGTLVRMLHEADDFRVRVQAAFALGGSADVRYRGDLERALRDRNEAVRAAAATALGRLGSPAALPALEGARRDSSLAVRNQVERSIATLSATASPGAPRSTPVSAIAAQPFRPTAWDRVRAVVVLGEMSDRSGFSRGSLAGDFRQEVATNFANLERIAIFPAATNIDAGARAEIDRRHVPMVRVDGSLLRVATQERPRDLAVRCEVSLTLLDEPARNLRGMMQGAATGIEARERDRHVQEERLARQALAGAVRSAMSAAQNALTQISRR